MPMRSPWEAVGLTRSRCLGVGLVLSPALLCTQLVLAPASLLSQDVAAPGATSRVEVVRVDVAVTDRHGRPVSDLVAEDFEVREDGAPRTITNFTYVVVGASPLPQAAKRPSMRAPVGEPGAPASAPPRARQRRILAFVIDDLNLSRTSIVRVRDLLKRFVEKSLHPDDLVGLFRTGVPSTTLTLGADRGGADREGGRGD